MGRHGSYTRAWKDDRPLYASNKRPFGERCVFQKIRHRIKKREWQKLNATGVKMEDLVWINGILHLIRVPEGTSMRTGPCDVDEVKRADWR